MNDMQDPQQAIEHLFELYADDVYRYARYTVANQVDAKDVVQEVFLRAFRAWDHFRQESNPRTWLFHIARNYMYDLLRKKRTEINYYSKHKPDLSDVSVPLHTLIELEEAVSQLRPAYRQVFILRCVQEMSVEETAEILAWSGSKVKTTLHRAVRQLRELLGNEFRKEGERNAYEGNH